MQPPPSMTASVPGGKDRVLERRFDLLRVGFVRKTFLSSGFPYAFQGLTLAAFVVLVLLGWQIYPDGNGDARLFAQSNLVTLVVWGLWWPMMIWTAVLLGRLWCTVCPLELVSGFTERVGRRLGIVQWNVPAWIRGGAVVVFLYVVIQLLVAGMHINRVPAYTSFFLIGLLTVAALAGFMFKDRAFCRGFCPIGVLLNAYGRGGMLAVRPASGAVCDGCSGKDCVMACHRHRWQGRSCPSLLNPPRLSTNRDCLVCGQCIKSCRPDNMRLFLRFPFSAADGRERMASWPLTLFVMVASGFVTSELATESGLAHAVFTWIPDRAVEALGVFGAAGWIEGLWMLIGFPAILWTAWGGLSTLTKRERISRTWRQLALPVAVVVSAGHMGKALAKFISWIGFLDAAFMDPSGQKTASAISSGLIHAPAPLFDIHVASFLSALLIVVATFIAFREKRLADPEGHRVYAVPKLALAAVFLAIVSVWGR